MRNRSSSPILTSLLFKIPKMDGIFHYLNESFVVDPLNDFEGHSAWLPKTFLLSRIGQSPWKLCMVKYLSVSEWFWDFRIFHFSTVSLFNKVVAWKSSLVYPPTIHKKKGGARWELSSLINLSRRGLSLVNKSKKASTCRREAAALTVQCLPRAQS